jgi:hypothetical protein
MEINGAAIVHMPTRVADVLNRLPGLFVCGVSASRAARRLLCALLDGPGRESDLFFLAEERGDRLTCHELAGPADLVVEVIFQRVAHA